MKKIVIAALATLWCGGPAADAAMVQWPSQGVMMPGYYVNGPFIQSATGNTGSITSSSIKVAYIGWVYQNDLTFRNGSATKNINHVSFGTNTISCAGCTSKLQVDIEGLSNSGPPMQPDGTILGSGNAKAQINLSSLTSFAWQTGLPNLTASATVSYGQAISVVFSLPTYDSGTFQLNANSGVNDYGNFGPIQSLFNGSSWALSAFAPPLQVEFDDGTVGGLIYSMPYNGGLAPINDTFNSGSNPNEIGMVFQFNFNAQVDQLCAAISVADASTTGVIELSDYSASPTIMASVAFDGHTARSTGTGTNGLSCFPIPVQSLSRLQQYVVSVKATSASAHNVTIPSLPVGAASSWTADRAAGTAFAYVTRNGGAWSAITTTQRPAMTVIVSAMDDGTGP